LAIEGQFDRLPDSDAGSPLAHSNHGDDDYDEDND
jgi:hypothetical protein